MHEEEAEKDEKFPEEEESPEAVRARKKQEYIAKQKEMLQNEVSSIRETNFKSISCDYSSGGIGRDLMRV